MLQMVSAIDYMHSNKVIHRDLKLGNFFLNSQMQIKSGDFGLAAALSFYDDRRVTVCGTPNYISPEILDPNKYNGHSFQVDIWSLGVIMYAMIVGRPPFETTDIQKTYKRIRTLDFTFPENIMISEDAKDLICRILVLDPLSRLSISKIRSHPFFHKGHKIPRFLPASTLACPPSASYMKKFQITYDDELEQKNTEDRGLSRQTMSVQSLRTYGSRVKLNV